jgi:hypothetical protein
MCNHWQTALPSENFKIPINTTPVSPVRSVGGPRVPSGPSVNPHALVAIAAGRSARLHRPLPPLPKLRLRLRDSLWSGHGLLPIAAGTRLSRLQGDWPQRGGPSPDGDRRSPSFRRLSMTRGAGSAPTIGRRHSRSARLCSPPARLRQQRDYCREALQGDVSWLSPLMVKLSLTDAQQTRTVAFGHAGLLSWCGPGERLVSLLP